VRRHCSSKKQFKTYYFILSFLVRLGLAVNNNLRWNCFLRRRFVAETFCYRRGSVTETLCYGDVLYGDVLSRRHFVWRRFVCAPKIHAAQYYNILP
jgi:hypothetical protein